MDACDRAVCAGQGLDDLPELRQELERAIVDEPPFTVREGGMIRAGYSDQVDQLRSIQTGGRDLVAQMEARVKEECGIRNLKVSYNKVFGYYIEVAKSQTDLVPEHWVRKQTTVNSERYINQELKELEHTILSAGAARASVWAWVWASWSLYACSMPPTKPVTSTA